MKKMNEPSTPTRTYTSLYCNPLNDLRHCRSYSSSSGGGKAYQTFLFNDDKENSNSNANTNGSSVMPKPKPKPRPRPLRSLSTDMILKPSWLESQSLNLNIWDYSESDSESAPASSWSTLPNKSLICRPLPLDIGSCTCFIVKEVSVSVSGGTFFSLYTNEGQGRQNRKLAVAHHKRRNGRSHFSVAQNLKGLLSHSDDSFLGTVTANLIGSKYHIWDQGSPHTSRAKQPLAVVTYIPTVTTCTGSHRSMRAYIPMHHQSMSLKNTTQVQHIKGLPSNWEGKVDKVHQLFSKVPLYNKISKQYELDFRDNKGKAGGFRIQRSVKNFQLTLEENGRQTILQLGRVAKSKFVMDYRYPLTGYQAFCISLASIDAKLCCTL